MGTFNAYMALSGVADTDVVENERLSRHTSYRIGGPTALFVTCHSYHALRRALEVLDREQVPWVILGKGSNVLASDEGYAGAVVTLGRDFSRFVFSDEDPGDVTAGAGVILSRLVNEALKRGLSGLEFCVGIPGTLGGAVSMNAGSRDAWIGSAIEEVTVLNPETGFKHYRYDDLYWGYRETSLPGNEIVLEARLRLAPGDKREIGARMEQSLARRKRTQPVGKPSCGSVFRNPAGGHVGKMIDECGLKGFSVGGAQVSPVHANFIVITGTARAEVVVEVISHVRSKVKETYGVELQPEVKFLGF